MEHIDLFQVITHVLTFIVSQDAQREADQCPHMNHRVVTAVMLAEFVNLGVAVVAAGDAVVRTGGLDLLVFEPTVLETLLLESGLEKTAAAAATEVVGAVGLHVDEVFFSYDGFHHVAKVFGNGVAKTLAHDLAGILDGKLDFQVLVPVGVDLQSTFTNPFSIVFVDVFNFKVVLKVEFCQSGPD